MYNNNFNINTKILKIMSKEEPKEAPKTDEIKPEEQKNDKEGEEGKNNEQKDNNNNNNQQNPEQNNQNAQPKKKSDVPIEIVNTVIPIPETYLNSINEKNELERVRRWKVKIEEFQISPTPSILDAFLEVTIGGNLKIYAVHNTQKNTSKMKRTGKRGFCAFTECKETDVKSPTSFDACFELELRDSIINLKRQNLVIELWDYNTWMPNTYKGIGMIPLFDIIKGSIYRTVSINGIKIGFKIVFQELWDFELSFEDWSLTNVKYLFGINESNKTLKPTISFDMYSIKEKVNCLHPKSGVNNPQWNRFSKNMLYRGTLNDLENEKIVATIEANSSFLDKRQIRRPIGLKGITSSGLITQSVPPERKKGKDNKEVIEMKEIKNELPLALDSTMSGKVNINEVPKYKQTGFDSTISEKDCYICVYIKDLSSGDIPPFVKKPLNIFISLEYEGKQYETKKIRIMPNTQIVFNTEINFLFGIDIRHIKDEDEIYNRVLTELENTNIIEVFLWVEDCYETLTALGKFNILLTDVFEKGRYNEEKQYKNYKNDSIKYNPKIFTGNDKFKSAYKYNEISLNYQAWFFPEKLSRLEITREKLKKKIGTNPVITFCEEISHNSVELMEKIKIKLFNQYSEISKRFFDFSQVQFNKIPNEDLVKQMKELPFFVLDQNNKLRFLSSYLSKLSIQEGNYDEDLLLQRPIAEIIKERAYLDKITLPIKTEKGFLRYTKNQRWNSLDHDYLLLSPDYFIRTKQGTKYEHAIFFSCLLMTHYSNHYQINDSELASQFVARKVRIDVNRFMAKEQLFLPDYYKLAGKYKNSLEEKEKEKDKKKKDKKNKKNKKDTEKKEEEDEESKYRKIKAEEDRQKNIKIIELKKDLLDVSSFDSGDLIFICMGTLKAEIKDSYHIWVMAFTSDLKDVIFYEPLTCKIYKLKNRVKYPEVLWYFLRGGFTYLEEANVFIEDSNKNLPKQIVQTKKIEPIQKQKANKIQNAYLDQNEEYDDQLQDIDPHQIIEEMEHMDFLEDMKHCFKYDNNNIENTFNKIYQPEDTKKQDIKKLLENKGERTFLQMNRLEKEKEKVEDFTVNKNSTMEQFFLKRDEFKVIKNEVLPYRTLDVVFNKKNIYINLQNPNPVGIFYDLYDTEKWQQFLRVPSEPQKNQKEEHNEDKSKTIQEPSIQPKTTTDITKISEYKIWKEEIPSFYSFKIFSNPYPSEEIDKMKKSILFEFQKTIRSIRNQKGLSSFFKTTREMKEILELYLIYIEMYQLGLTTKEQHIERLRIWNKHFIEKMNNRTKCSILPLSFIYSNDIHNFLFNCQDFLFKNLKDGFIMIVCKIFQYPNKVLSIRVIIMLCSKTQEGLKEPEHEFYQMTNYDDNLLEDDGGKDPEASPLIDENDKGPKIKKERIKKMIKIVRIGNEKINKEEDNKQQTENNRVANAEKNKGKEKEVKNNKDISKQINEKDNDKKEPLIEEPNNGAETAKNISFISSNLEKEPLIVKPKKKIVKKVIKKKVKKSELAAMKKHLLDNK